MAKSIQAELKTLVVQYLSLTPQSAREIAEEISEHDENWSGTKEGDISDYLYELLDEGYLLLSICGWRDEFRLANKRTKEVLLTECKKS